MGPKTLFYLLRPLQYSDEIESLMDLPGEPELRESPKHWPELGYLP